MRVAIEGVVDRPVEEAALRVVTLIEALGQRLQALHALVAGLVADGTCTVAAWGDAHTVPVAWEPSVPGGSGCEVGCRSQTVELRASLRH